MARPVFAGDVETDHEGATFGTLYQTCEGCGAYTAHSFLHGPEGGHETCEVCGHDERWGF